MVLLDRRECSGCGLCARICHEHCMRLVGEVITIDYKSCSTCTQCIAVCPEKALSWNNIAPVSFDSSLLPSMEQFDELLKERRTTRSFRTERIERETLERLVDYGAYAPTHNFNLRAVVVDDPEIIRLTDRVIFGFNRWLYKLAFRPRFMPVLLRLMPVVVRSEYFRARPKLEASLKIGRAFQSPPAALIFLVGDRRIPLSRESAQYALYNIALCAQLQGIGSRNLVGNQMILNRSTAIRRRLHLGRYECIFGTLGIGYPSIVFRNKVIGRKIDIKWNGR